MIDLDIFENDLIEQFRQHPVLKDIELLSDADFVKILLQRRFISFAFTTVYDLAIDMLQDEASVRIARIILREEYPDGNGYSPSHREDLKNDLLRIGVSKEDIAASSPTRATIRTITKTLALAAETKLDEFVDLRLLTILRFWGEVLVSVEYGEFWRRIGPLFMKENKNFSRFYYPHYVHDAKKHPLTATSSRSSTHSDRLGVRLNQLLTSDRSKGCFMNLEKDILLLKMKFYDQFLHMLPKGA